MASLSLGLYIWPLSFLELPLPLWRSTTAKKRKRYCFAHLGFIFFLFGELFLSDQGFQGAYHGLAECSGQVKVCGFVNLGDWQLLDGLGVWRVLSELFEVVGASRKSWCTRSETHRSGDGERVLLVSTWVFMTWGGAILLVSAPTWIRGERQLLDTTGKIWLSLVPLSTSLHLFSAFIFHI
jgi:hypothetical protein